MIDVYPWMRVEFGDAKFVGQHLRGDKSLGQQPSNQGSLQKSAFLPSPIVTLVTNVKTFDPYSYKDSQAQSTI